MKVTNDHVNFTIYVGLESGKVRMGDGSTITRFEFWFGNGEISSQAAAYGFKAKNKDGTWPKRPPSYLAHLSLNSIDQEIRAAALKQYREIVDHLSKGPHHEAT